MSNKSIHEKWAEDYDRKYISMDNRRKYEHPVQPYSIQSIVAEPGDVILAHVSEDLNIDTVNDTWYIYPQTDNRVVTKIHLATEALYDRAEKKLNIK